MITSLGGSGLMGPVAAALAVWLGTAYRARAAWLWTGLLGGAALCVSATKLAFLGWGIGVRSLDFTGISGHATLASAVFPTLLYVLLLPAGYAARVIGLMGGCALGLAVGISRVAVHAHSVSETVAGCALGVAVAFVFAFASRNATAGAPRQSRVLAALIFALLFGLLHDFRLPTQRWLTRAALELSGRSQPFVRVRWHAGHYDAPRSRSRLDDLLDRSGRARPPA